MASPVPQPPDITHRASRHRRVVWPLISVLTLVVGIVIGIGIAPADEQPTAAASEPAKQSGALEKDDPRLADLEAQVTTLTEERDELQSTVDEQEARIAELEVTIEPEPVEEEPVADGTYTAGDYTFADVQVSEDFAGDFELRARVTNGGGGVQYATWTATIFADGSVVGTAVGVVDSIDTDETVTVSFISTDDYTDWDLIEFQVDSEW